MSAADTGKKLLCPMPGLVVSIAVSEGQEVKSGETLIDSGAIIDHLDEQAGPARALIPPHGAERRRIHQAMATRSNQTHSSVAHAQPTPPSLGKPQLPNIHK